MEVQNKKVLYNKRYYEKHLDEIKRKNKIRVHCDVCNCDVNKSSYSHHQDTKKHVENYGKRIKNYGGGTLGLEYFQNLEQNQN